jgi:hypothetical protein
MDHCHQEFIREWREWASGVEKTVDVDVGMIKELLRSGKADSDFKNISISKHRSFPVAPVFMLYRQVVDGTDNEFLKLVRETAIQR